jgi:diguanylate cyclase (GGDEF)-like protein/PAS domain S-box-containing protein
MAWLCAAFASLACLAVVATWLHGRQRLARAHKTHRQREHGLLMAMESMDCGLWELEIRTGTCHFEGAFYEVFGLFEQADAQRIDYWINLRHPDDRARLAQYLQRTMAGEIEQYEAAFRVRDKQGQWRQVLARGRVAERDAQGRPLRLTGFDQDVSQHHHAQQALQSSEAKHMAMYQLLPDAAGITRLADGCFLEINPAFLALMGGTREEWLGKTSVAQSTWAVAAQREQFIQALRRDGLVTGLPMQAMRQGQRIECLISARMLQLEGEECLVFVLHDRTDEERTRQELLDLNSVLQQAGRMARLGAWEDEPGKGLVYWSEVCFDIHGLPRDAPLPQDYIARHIAPPWQQALRARFRECIRHQVEWSMEMQIVRADGQLLWVRARGEPVVENGRVRRMRGVLQDIDEAKRAQERLQATEERFSRLFQLADMPIGLSRSSDGTYMMLNPAWETLVGIAREEAIGQSAEALGIIDAPQRAAMLATASPEGVVRAYELTLRARNGELRTVLQSMRQVEFDGEQCWLFNVQDISERKRQERQVREREELLLLTVSAASLGLWDWNLQTGLMVGDERWHAMRGMPTPDGLRPPISWTSGAPAEDIARIHAEVARHAEHPATPFDITWHLPLQDGRVRWVRNLGKIMAFDSSGLPLRMLGVSMDVTQQREQQEQLQRLAHFDALTALPNRVQLAQRLQEDMQMARRAGRQLGVAYLDLDGFKPVNDRLGHTAGDQLLVRVAARLQAVLRPLDCVARLGGDEFVLLLPGLTSHEACEKALHKIMNAICAPYLLDAERVSITTSIGYTLFPEDDADADTLVRHADQAMYQAKQAGRNRFHRFDAALDRRQREQREQTTRLRQALERKEFVLYLQPKVDMRTGTVMGAEALARWQHPERGLLSPGAFLPVLAGSELEISFGQWVFVEALHMIEALCTQGQRLPLSINVAAQHLQQPGFADWVLAQMARHPLVTPSLVELEVTESAALYDVEHVAAELAQLRECGLSVALDDFGTGYSSLTYLRRLPMDTLKIDQSFVHGMMGDPGDLAIVQGVIGLARSFGHRVIAEGVETAEQGQMLLRMGCTLAQGYCVARPMPFEEFLPWMARWTLPAEWQRRTF